jgi:hypothetical protein
MRTHLSLSLAVLTLTAGGLAKAQVEVDNPITAPVVKRGLAVEIENVARLPDSSALDPARADGPVGWARVSFVRDAPDGRRFANDSRGGLYLIGEDDETSEYANLAQAYPQTFYRGLESGFIGFAFHPDFARNGLFYTVHGEQGKGNPNTPDFIPPGFTNDDVTYQSVITEWHADDPAAARFTGTRRELLRVGHIVANFRHPFGYVGFNPTSEPGDTDYGLLYTSGSDLGFSNGGGPHQADPSQTQRLDTLIGAILRIDPRSPSESGGAKGVGDYTIPPNNPFARDDDPRTFGEIYAYGFRNAHRLSWDLTDGTMFASDIGMSNIEEIDIVHEGANYGWMRREGIFDNGVNIAGSDLDHVFALPADILDGRTQDGFTYPVAMYDHDEGTGVTAGFAYHGRIPALRGKFVFGDIEHGRLFAADLAALEAADDGIPGTTAPVEEIQLYVRDASGRRSDVSFWELIEQALGRKIERADLHLSRSRDGEIFVTSRQDGWIRMLVEDSGS